MSLQSDFEERADWAAEQLAEALAAAGVPVEGLHWEQLLYKARREAEGHRDALAQAGRAQGEREEWKRKARLLVEGGWGDDWDQGVGFTVLGEDEDSGELALELNVRGHTGHLYLSREVWAELGKRMGWA